jgi:hypothetical protein
LTIPGTDYSHAPSTPNQKRAVHAHAMHALEASMTEPVSTARYFAWNGGAVFVGTAGALPRNAHRAIQICFLFEGRIRQSDAAHAAGFADSAHLARTSRRMIRIPPSLLDLSASRDGRAPTKTLAVSFKAPRSRAPRTGR